MSQTASVWLVILAAVLAANLPFLSDRQLFGVWPLRASKPLGVRLLELLALYFLVGGIGLLLEKRLSQVTPQKWEFYAVTVALFLTLAFPGFVWRYLFKRRHD